MALGDAFLARPRIGTPTLRTLYVDAAASGSNNGLSEANAWTTFTSALGTAQAGDLVRVKAGTYTPTGVYDWGPPTGRQGTAANPIQFEAFDPANKPVLRSPTGNAQCMDVESTGSKFPSYTRFKNLIFEKHPSATGTQRLILVWHNGGTCQQIDFDGCVMRNGTGAGLFIRHDTVAVQVWNCEMYNNGTGEGAGLGHDAYMMGTNHVIAQNIFNGPTPQGFGSQLWTEEPNGIQGCWFVNNIGNNAGDGSGFGFGGEGAGEVDNNRVYNNIFTNNSEHAIAAYNQSSNTFTGNTGTNNLGFGNGSSPQFYQENNNVLATTQAAFTAANLSGNPLYVNEPGNDFHITNIASPAYNAGVLDYTPILDRDGNTRSQPDLGPYRIAAGVPPPGGGRRRGTTLGVR